MSGITKGVNDFYSYLGYQHVHQPVKTYPEGADPVTVTSSSSAAWTHGAKAEIIPASTINTAFDIHWSFISEVSAEDNYELKLYTGGAGSETEIASVAFSRGSSALNKDLQVPVQVPIQAPNARISASLACADGDGATCKIKLYTHEYDQGLIP
jgi:hypothetical protein